MVFQIIVWGKAKNQLVFKKKLVQSDLELTLMTFLKNHQIPVASSCNGEGVCKKCIVNTNIISCQVKVRDLIKENHSDILVNIAYL